MSDFVGGADPRLDRMPWLADAGRALTHALDGDPGSAARTVMRMVDEHGPASAAMAMQSWMDTVLHYRGIPAGHGAMVKLAFVDSETGAVSDADGVAPEWAWAGRMLAARAANDRDGFLGLLHAVPGNDLGKHVMVLLLACAVQLRADVGPPSPPGGTDAPAR